MLMKIPVNAVSQAFEVLVRADSYRAVKYLDDHTVVSVCRNGKPGRNGQWSSFVLKCGVPNYLERRFIKKCKRAGKRLPYAPQVQPWPRKRK